MGKRSSRSAQPESTAPPVRGARLYPLAIASGIGGAALVYFSWHSAGLSIGNIGALVMIGALVLGGFTLGVLWIRNGFQLPPRMTLLGVTCLSIYASAIVAVCLFVLVKFPQGMTG